MIETSSGEKELLILPRKRNWGRFTWLPQTTQLEVKEYAGLFKASMGCDFAVILLYEEKF